jgi:polyphosphate kinase
MVQQRSNPQLGTDKTHSFGMMTAMADVIRRPPAVGERERTPVDTIKLDQSLQGRYINRELSLLDFNARVLALAEDDSLALLERVRFLGIFSRNIDEFFQVRVGGLMTQRRAGVTAIAPDGSTPDEQLSAIRERVHALVQRQSRVFADHLVPALREARIVFVAWDDIDDASRGHLDRVFEEQIFPVLTPLAVDPAHPFPYISNLSLNLVVVVDDPQSSERRVARLKVPPLLPRFLALPDGERFVPIEQVIAAHLPRLFAGTEIVARHEFRVTRNADFQLEDEAEDLLEAVQGILHRRRRSPEAVRLEVERSTNSDVISVLVRELELNEADVYVVDSPLDLGGLLGVYALDRPDLKDPGWKPVAPPRFMSPPGEEIDIFRVLRSGPVLVQHPYESFEDSVEAFIEQAAADPHVLAIKQSLYRTSGPVSPIVRALVHAAEAGKQVVALIELTARFDEQANIAWAEMLEEAGVHVVYGIVGLKTHCKVTLVVREEKGAIRRYCHIGTGNYNPDTARMYEDIGLLSADPQLGADLSELFNMLTGYSRQKRYRRLLVSPSGLRSALLRMVDDESRKPDGYITIKVNSLTDPAMIDALYAASQAGTQIDLIVRGMCSLRPGVTGLSDTIRVRSIVGRYLEHSRIFRFGRDPLAAQYFIGSADLMHRNLDQRVEVVAPVLPEQLRMRLAEILDVCLADDVLAWQLEADGSWVRVRGAQNVATHARLQELALRPSGGA